ncbi:MAG TPA: gamma-glutamyl-gamma-aminobutyrate hydrolase family protein [Chloroflexota bacterium]|jgi:GMP synthase (glutamine-hydrolysing)|nr:gamma-glutamyl-gamma-aminobutyrate hydrolase family protein [Chloroflexota bacterium]
MAQIYVLQHVQPETMGTIALGLDAAGHSARTIRIFDGEPVPRNMDGAAGLIVMGGPMGVYERDRYPFLHEEMRLIERALKQEKPVLGVCLGSQLLAATLGADVAPAPQKEIGWYPVRLTEQAPADRLLSDVEPSFTGFHWHGDAFTLPQGAVPLAGSQLTRYQAYRYGRHAYGFLFHMEVTEQIVTGMVERFADELAGAGVSGEQIIEGIEEYLPRLESIAEMVFGRWATLIA